MRSRFLLAILSLPLIIAGCASEPQDGPDAGVVSDAIADTRLVPDAGLEASVPPTGLLAVVDLPRTADTQSLSGTWFDAASRTLFAVTDLAPRIVPLAVSEDFHTITPGTPIALTGRTESAWDGEALFRKDDVFYTVTVETLPLVERFDATGKALGQVELPSIYQQQAVNNKGLESLTIAPSGKVFFTVNESALTMDGSAATKTQGTTLRLLRRDLTKSQDEARAYRTEPLGPGTAGDMGVSEMLALSNHELLVMERGYQSDYGNTVRIFQVDFDAAGPASADVLAAATLDSETPVLDKTLVLDLITLPSTGVSHPGLQANPIMDNFEGLALGPTLADGRRVVFVTSDDNARSTQVPRVVVLAIRGI